MINISRERKEPRLFLDPKMLYYIRLLVTAPPTIYNHVINDGNLGRLRHIVQIIVTLVSPM